MDLALSADERAFALKVRAWLARNTERPDVALGGDEAIRRNMNGEQVREERAS